MRIRTSDDAVSPELRDQFEHEAMKAWMLDHGYSVSFSRDPADIYELIQELGDDTDFNAFNN